MPAHLNRKQQREIKAVVERAKKDNGIPQTAQQSIPFQRMFPDGICRVTDNYYTKTMHCLKSLKRTIPMLLPILFHDGGKSITSRKNMPQHEPEKAERLRQRVQERLQKE